MPYSGAPFVAEGSAEGYLDAITQVLELHPRRLDPNSLALRSSRSRALTTLIQINSQMNPFRFIVYSEWSGGALAPVSPQ